MHFYWKKMEDFGGFRAQKETGRASKNSKIRSTFAPPLQTIEYAFSFGTCSGDNQFPND